MPDPDDVVGRAPVSPESMRPGPADPGTPDRNRRRRGSRGGRNRPRPVNVSTDPALDPAVENGAGSAHADWSDDAGPERSSRPLEDDRRPDDLPERHRENKPSAEAAERALVRKPRIGDSMPSRAGAEGEADAPAPGRSGSSNSDGDGPRRKRRRGRGRGAGSTGVEGGGSPTRESRSSGRSSRPVESMTDARPIELDDETIAQRRGRERNGRPVGRYLMAVHVGPTDGNGNRGVIQIAVLEGRSLLEHYVSHPSDDVSQIHGNVYLSRVQNVLPGMEAAFVDIGTPKNAVLYRSDTRYDAEDIEEKGTNPRIEQILKAKQSILTQVSKNPIAHKGARLTQEISLPGRFVVLIPNSTTYGISKRLPDNERKRLRSILDKVKPKAHGLIVRTAAEGVTAEEIERDVLRLARQWEQIEALGTKSQAPALLYREPDMAVRVIREEFNKDYRKVVIDDRALYEEVRDYVRSISPALEHRVELYDPVTEPLPLLETFHVHEQLHKALDRKVWLPSGGSLIIEGTEALTVIDVNTGKNVGTSSLEETVYRNNLEAATEIARQLRLRDIGGIIVIDFVDMEIRANRDNVISTFRDALARDKTRTQVFDISELGLVEMTRKRIGEGLLESFSTRCLDCEGRGVVVDKGLLGGD